MQSHHLHRFSFQEQDFSYLLIYIHDLQSKYIAYHKLPMVSLYVYASSDKLAFRKGYVWQYKEEKISHMSIQDTMY